MKRLPEPCERCGRHVIEATPARARPIALVTPEELRDAMHRVLIRRSEPVIVAVCIRCQEVIYAGQARKRTRNGMLCAHCSGGR